MVCYVCVREFDYHRLHAQAHRVRSVASCSLPLYVAEIIQLHHQWARAVTVAANSTYHWQCHRPHPHFPQPGRRSSAACSSPAGSAHSTCFLSGLAVSIPSASIATDHSCDESRRRRRRMQTACPGGIDYMDPDTLVWASRQAWRCFPAPFWSPWKRFWQGRSHCWSKGNARRLSSSCREKALCHHPSSSDHIKTSLPHMSHSRLAIGNVRWTRTGQKRQARRRCRVGFGNYSIIGAKGYQLIRRRVPTPLSSASHVVGLCRHIRTCISYSEVRYVS